MKSTFSLRLLLSGLSLAFAGFAGATDINGAGATFPYAAYNQWAQAYKTAKGHQVNYQGIGSSGGVKQIVAKTVDFGATDAPQKAEELKEKGLIQVPTLIGGVVIVANLPGLQTGQLKLDGKTAAAIFRGAITRWNDPAIVALNKTVKLPATPITIAHRSDGSGTTYVFTHYLSGQSPEFKSTVGAGSTGNWPANAVGGKGNPGVAANVQKIAGAIGYVDLADAIKSNLPMVALKNKAGHFIVPQQKAIQDAASSADFNVAGMAPDLLDQAHKNAWPITSATYVLVYAKGADAAKQKTVVDFFTWSLNNGSKMAESLGFVPLPKKVIQMVEKELRKVQ